MIHSLATHAAELIRRLDRAYMQARGTGPDTQAARAEVAASGPGLRPSTTWLGGERCQVRARLARWWPLNPTNPSSWTDRSTV